MCVVLMRKKGIALEGRDRLATWARASFANGSADCVGIVTIVIVVASSQDYLSAPIIDREAEIQRQLEGQKLAAVAVAIAIALRSSPTISISLTPSLSCAQQVPVCLLMHLTKTISCARSTTTTTYKLVSKLNLTDTDCGRPFALPVAHSLV